MNAEENGSEPGRPPTAGPAGECPACGARRTPSDVPHAHRSPEFVYALGQIDFRPPDLGVEKELAQTIGRAETAGLTNRQVVSRALTLPENRYLARQMCYVFSVNGVETYVLTPRDPADFGLLAEAVRPDQRETALDLVIGVRGPVAPPAACAGPALPMVSVDQVYSFTVADLVGAIERPADMDAENFGQEAEGLLRTVMGVSGNVGVSDEHRALNHLLVRYSAVYRKTFERSMNDFSLTSLDVRPAGVDGPRRVMHVVFSYTSRRTEVREKFFVPVDVTDEFPFRRGGLSPYYDHR